MVKASEKNKIPSQLKAHLEHFSVEEIGEIANAYAFAREKHKNQKRLSGSAYILHPLRVAVNLARAKHDKTIIIASLLHDTLEDTTATYEEIQSTFGITVADLVQGVTAISKIKIQNKADLFSRSINDLYLEQVDNYRKLLLATSKDMRVILIKLYDRLDNIATVKYLPEIKQKFYAKETIEIFAPIAERLGMGAIKGELEDLAFPYAYPDEFKKFIKKAKKAYKNPKQVIAENIPFVEKTLAEHKIENFSVSGRAKHLYSLYQKITNQMELSLVFDIAALRIIVDDLEDCYKTLGIIHAVFKPIPGRIFDYIARPKRSGYQSLHTTVQDASQNVFEIQIRTRKMHEQAEYGTAAHWKYKDQENNVSTKSQKEWLEEIQKIKKIEDRQEFLATVKEEMFSKQIFALTPRGDIINLPVGATPIDFAYRIHTNVGNRFSGVKINGRIMPAKTELKTGDVIDIITSKKAIPSKDWIGIAKTANAKSKIKNAIRDLHYDELLLEGTKIMDDLIKKNKLNTSFDHTKASRRFSESRLPFKNLDSALVALAEGNITQVVFLKTIFPDFKLSQKKKEKIIIKDEEMLHSLRGIRHTFARCCKPTSTSDNIGYLSGHHIIKVHRRNCKWLKMIDERRLLDL